MVVWSDFSSVVSVSLLTQMVQYDLKQRLTQTPKLHFKQDCFACSMLASVQYAAFQDGSLAE